MGNIQNMTHGTIKTVQHQGFSGLSLLQPVRGDQWRPFWNTLRHHACPKDGRDILKNILREIGKYLSNGVLLFADYLL